MERQPKRSSRRWEIHGQRQTPEQERHTTTKTDTEHQQLKNSKSSGRVEGPLSFGTQASHSDQSIRDDGHSTCERMTSILAQHTPCLSSFCVSSLALSKSHCNCDTLSSNG